jgi:hypothetical protein
MAQSKYGVRFDTGLTAGQDMAFLLCLAVALIVWSWACGFALGSLSGRAVWVTWSVFYLVVLDSTWVRLVLSGNLILRHAPLPMLLVAATLPLSIAALLFSLPALWGMLLGVRRRVLPVGHAYVLGVATAVLMFLMTWMSGWYENARETWSSGVWHGVSWPMTLLPFVIVSLPAAYLLTEAYRQHTGRGTT